MDVLTGDTVDGDKGEVWSYHSQPQLATPQRDKENLSVPKGPTKAIMMDVQQQRTRKPFQDNTNLQLTMPPGAIPKKPTVKKIHVEKKQQQQQQQQRNSLKELVPPLNAARLPPGLEELRNGVVSGDQGHGVYVCLCTPKHAALYLQEQQGVAQTART